MDPLSAAGFASAILTFVDFSVTLVKGSYANYRSATDTTAENALLSTVLDDLRELAGGLRSDATPNNGDDTHRVRLAGLATECLAVADELAAVLEEVRRKEGNKAWRSVEAMWKGMRKEKAIASIEQRLNSIRIEVLLRLNVIIGEEQTLLKTRLDEVARKGLRLSPQAKTELVDAQRASHEVCKSISDEICTLSREESRRDQSLSEIRNGLSALLARLETIPNTTDTENMVLRKLYFDAMHSREDSIIEASFGTFSWLLGDDPEPAGDEQQDNDEQQNNDLRNRAQQSFLTWLRTENKIYHISGKAGSGKSTLMKYLGNSPRVEQHLKSWAGEKKLVFASFYFWAYGSNQERTLLGLYQSILYRTLTECPELIKEAFPGHAGGPNSTAAHFADVPFRLAELKAALHRLVQRTTFTNYRFCFFIDGLDEFQADMETDHWELAELLNNWATSSPDIKLCVSSRPYEAFLQGFDNERRMRLHDLTTPDVRRFVHATLGKAWPTAYDENILAEIVNTVVSRAEGVFLWVRLVVKSLVDALRRRFSADMLKQKLDQTPNGLNAFFGQLFDSIAPDDREASDKLLALAMFGLRLPMFAPDRIPAIAFTWIPDLADPDFPFNAPIRPMSDDEAARRLEHLRCQLEVLSKGMLELRREASDPDFDCQGGDLYMEWRVKFLHRSVVEYLEDSGRLQMIKDRLGLNCKPRDEICRLGLAAFQHARTTASYFNHPACYRLKFLFLDTLRLIKPDSEGSWSWRCLDQLERILQHHRSNPFSCPGAMGTNDGIIRWGHSRLVEPFDSSNFYPRGITHGDISFLHLLRHHGHSEYVMKRVRGDLSLMLPHGELSLLVSSLNGHLQSALIMDLLEMGASPNDEVLSPFPASSSGYHKQPINDRSRTVTVWAVLLFKLACHCTIFKEMVEHIQGYWLAMQQFIEHGADPDVYFLYKALPNPGERGAEIVADSDSDADGSVKDASGSGSKVVQSSVSVSDEVDEAELLALTLEELILFTRPTNADELMGLIRNKRTGLWGSAKRLTSLAFSPWAGKAGGHDWGQGRYRRLEIPEGGLSRQDYDLHAIYIGGRRFETDFAVRSY